MILLDKPYVSEFLQNSLIEKNIPVIHTSVVDELELSPNLNLISEEEAIKLCENDPNHLLYSNSENAISWISKQPALGGKYNLISIFKDKALFREVIRPLYPNYYFESINLDELEDLDKESMPYPLIFKPAIGFFSMGVYKINNADDWKGLEKKVLAEIKQVEHLYPKDVFDSSAFIIEECIEGREFAIDAYFDKNGKSVILNIMEHYFSSGEDVSDRLYATSDSLIKEFLAPFSDLIDSISKLMGIRNFPIHLEVRVTEDGQIIPIEVNPMRFGGWCTTADFGGMAWGFNPYHMFFESEKPNWDDVLASHENCNYTILLLDNSTDIDGSEIASFNYEAIASKFSHVLELRKVDYTKYPIFGFLFLKTNDSDQEALAEILKSSLMEYIEK